MKYENHESHNKRHPSLLRINCIFHESKTHYLVCVAARGTKVSCDLAREIWMLSAKAKNMPAHQCALGDCKSLWKKLDNYPCMKNLKDWTTAPTKKTAEDDGKRIEKGVGSEETKFSNVFSKYFK